MVVAKKRPKKCCYPDCFNCPYIDCRWDSLTTLDYSETNNRDYFLYEDSTGNKYHKGSDPDYRQKRQIAYQRENRKPVDRHDYNQRYYAEHGAEIRKKRRESYNTADNTIKCRKYRKRHINERKAYEKLYYEVNKEKIKQRARERYYKRKAAANA